MVVLGSLVFCWVSGNGMFSPLLASISHYQEKNCHDTDGNKNSNDNLESCTEIFGIGAKAWRS